MDISLLGISLNAMSLDQLVDRDVKASDEHRQPITFACANPHSLAVMKSDRVFEAALKQTDIVVADGIGIMLAGKITGRQVGPRIAGNDYFWAANQRLDTDCRSGERKGRVYFFGSSDLVLKKIQERFRKDFPNLEICGVCSPPFGEWSEQENAMMIEAINQAKPDLIWVGMTAPKQEKWVHANKDRLNASVIGSIGAVFDFYAGTNSRAPEWVRRLGMEWLVRLVKEPRRMWRRTFVSLPVFLAHVLKQHVIAKG